MQERFWVKTVVNIRPAGAATITSIIEQCLQEKIPFYGSNNFPDEKHELSGKQVVTQFLEGLHPVNPYYSLGFVYEKEPFLLELYRHESEPATWIQLSALNTIRHKKGETGIMRIDLAYYAKLLLLLCKNLPLLEFCTVIDSESSNPST